jgi:hypothetical protein
MDTNDTVAIKIKLIDEISQEIKSVRTTTERQFDAINASVKQSHTAFAGLGQEIKGSFVNAVRGGIIAFVGFEVINKVTAFLKLARAEAKENIEAQLQLKASLGYTSIALQEQAEFLGKKLLIDDADITRAQAMLGNYIKEEESIKKLTPAILDLSAAKGIDLRTASEMVGRAIASNSDELVKLGINFGTAKTEAERIDMTLIGLKSHFAGHADAVRESKDVIDEVSFSWKKMAENMGYALGLVKKTEDKYYEEAKKRLKSHFDETDLRYVINYEKRQAEDKERATQQEKERKQTEQRIEQEKVDDKNRKDRQKKAQEEREALDREAYQIDQNLLKRNEDDQTKLRKDQLDKEKKIRDDKIEMGLVVFDFFKETEEKTKKEQDDANERIKRQQLIERQEREATARVTVDNMGVVASKWHAFGGLYKRMAQAEALVDTYASAQAAFKSMAGIPYVGPALGFVAAAAAVGAGLARVAMIESQQFAVGTQSAPGGLSWVGEQGPELMSVPRGSQVYTNDQSRHIVNNSGGNTLVYNHYDHAGTLTESIAVELRGGKGDRLVSEMLKRMGRN